MDDNTHYEESTGYGDWYCLCGSWPIWSWMDLLWWVR